MDYLEMRELYHHGIDGQKWGVKNGPPYPLPYSAHTPIEKRENPKSVIDNYRESKRQMKRDFKRAQETEKTKQKVLVKINKEYDKLDKKAEKKVNSAEKNLNLNIEIDRAVHDNPFTRKVRQLLDESAARYSAAEAKRIATSKARLYENNAVMSLTLEELKARLRG